MLVFLFVFVSGVFADLLETRQSRSSRLACAGLLGASAVWNLVQLWVLAQFAKPLTTKATKVHEGKP